MDAQWLDELSWEFSYFYIVFVPSLVISAWCGNRVFSWPSWNYDIHLGGGGGCIW